MSTANELTGTINPDELYTFEAFKRRLGVREGTIRAARRAGLRVHYVHRMGYIYGRDWIDYVRQANTSPNGDSLRDVI
jgi:hypothetical protein